MRTKKVEIANVPDVAVSEAADKAVAVASDIAEVDAEPAVPVAVEFEVAFRFQKRENAESFIAKTKTLGYDNSELREV